MMPVLKERTSVMNIIEFKDVIWQRNHKTILNEVNWAVKPGEHWTILGLNGSGKTSLLNMVNGYAWPTKGTISVLGETFGQTNIHALRKRIGWVSSSLQSRIAGHTRIEDIVISGKFASTGMYDEPTEADYAFADELIEQLNISYLKGRHYVTCSQGEQQKILIARGLMAKPEILILDEPTNGLDFLSREELMRTISNLALKEQALTLIFVTHHIEEILPMFTHSLLLKKGQVFAKGDRKEMLTSEHLTKFFDVGVQVNWSQDRAWLHLEDES